MGRLASALASAALAAPHTYNALQQIQPQQRAPANGLLVDEGAMPRLEVSWNSPSEMCTTGAKDVNVTIADPAYRVAVNADAALNGRVVSILYGEGAWPALNATLNATACWEKVRASEQQCGVCGGWRCRPFVAWLTQSSFPPAPQPQQANCSWTPWGEIWPISNGGVPQAGDVDAHAAAVANATARIVPDEDFEGLLVMDWEAWRPLFDANDDNLGVYSEYSRRLVRADPSMAGANASVVDAEAQRRFDEGAKTFFLATVAALKSVRPNARVGFYSQGIDGPNSTAGRTHDDALLWLWDAVDLLLPSIYPRKGEAPATALARIAGIVTESQRSSDMVAARRRERGDSEGRAPPVVMPYSRALAIGCETPPVPITPEVLATQVQLVAALGVEGVILWGSSDDFQDRASCEIIEKVITGFAGDAIGACVADRERCAASLCSGKGRCVDNAALELSSLSSLCVAGATAWNATCRCDFGSAGDDCSLS